MVRTLLRINVRSNTLVDSNEPEWIIEQTQARKRRELLRQREDMEARLEKIRAKEKAQREKYLKGDQTFKKRKTDAEKSEEGDEEQFILDDYDSDREQNGIKNGSAISEYSTVTLELMEKLGMGSSTIRDEDAEIPDETKVRNHHSRLKS
jgi:chromosome transmission fidelity protein 1